MKATKILSNYFVLCALWLLFGSSAAKAEFAFSPLTSTIEAIDGQGQSTLVISNSSDKPIRLQISFSEWDVKENNEIFILNSSALTQYLKASPKQVTVPARQAQKVRISVSLPKDQPVKKEYKFLTNILEINDERSLSIEAKSNINFKMNCLISSALYVLNGKSEDFKADFSIKDILLKQKDEKFKYQLDYENSGNVHIREIIKIRIYNLQNEPVAERYLGSLIAFPTEAGKSLKVEGEFAVTGANEISAIELILSDVENNQTISKIFDL